MQMKNVNISQLGTSIDIEKLTLNELLNFSSHAFLSVADHPNSALLNNNNNQLQQPGPSSNAISGGVNNAVYKPVPTPKPLTPPYRMPPQPPGGAAGSALYNEQLPPIPIPGATCTNYEIQSQSLRAHSSKFPIERELVLSNEKGSTTKIPLMNDNRPIVGIRRGNGLQLLPRQAIAPDHPPKQMHAWNAQSQVHQNHIEAVQQQQQQQQHHHQPPQSTYQNNNASLTGAIPRTPARLPEDVTAEFGNKNNGDNKDSKNAVTKTYHTLKDLISSKFKKDSLDNVDELNNVTSLSSAHNQQQQQQQNLQFSQQQGPSNVSSGGSDDYRSPYSALPAHMRQVPNMNQQPPQNGQQQQMWQHSTPSPTAQMQQPPSSSSNLNPSQQQLSSAQRSYGQSSGPANGGVSAQQRATSQPQLNVPFERRGSQNNLLEQVNERRGSLANIDVTDSDDGGFNTKARRPVTMYQVQPQQHTPSPTQQNMQSQRQSPQVFQPNSSFQSAYASNLAHNYQQQQQFHGQQPSYQNMKMDVNKTMDGSNSMLPNRQDVIRTSFQRTELGSNTPDSLNMQRPPELPLKPGQKPSSHGRQTPAQELSHGGGGGVNGKQPGSAASSDYDKSGNQSSNVDSGRGSAAYSSGRKGVTGGVIHDTSPENSDSLIRVKDNDSEWVDIVDAELRNILEPGMQSLTLRPESTISGSVSSMSPPLPTSPSEAAHRYKPPNQTAKDKQEYGTDSYNRPNRSSGPIGPSRAGWPGSTVQKQGRSSGGGGGGGGGGSSKKQEQILLKRHLFGLDNDIASTTTRSLDLESLLGTPWGAGQSVSDSETDTQGLRHIRSQLEGLEHMYGEVLRMLGSRMPGGAGRGGGGGGLHENVMRSNAARRRHGSLSSLPSSSVSGRPIRDRRRSDDRRKVRDMKGINKRFQRLESHVVTLARSVAHLSSEMRSQHMVTQELERMRDDLATLRAQAGRLQHLYRQTGGLGVANMSKGGGADPDSSNLTNPKRVKKLTKFFGEDPPLMRLFLKKLGYEKYANLFESERVGMIELPYLGEERLQKLGVPLGPRLRILQEAQISLCKDNANGNNTTLLCIV